MNLDILSSKIQDFINESLEANFAKVALMKNPFPEVQWSEILNQIASKSKSKEKLPTWFNKKNILYPSKISIEQTSSEIAAEYKASLIKGKTLIDLTGGFGVDDYYFSKIFNRVIHCELKKDLHQIVKHNFNILNATNIECYSGDSSLILGNLNQQFDWIYIDPSRRSDVKGKVFMLKDCSPNVVENLNHYYYYSTKILIKTAPILDITAALQELQNVREIHIVAINNEVKELLWILEKDFNGEFLIKTVNIRKEGIQEVSFLQNEKNVTCNYSLPKQILYEPNVALFKSGAFEWISNQFKIDKLHQNSHLYTSNENIDFPGRKFKVNLVFNYSKNEMKTHLENQKANISIRNFPEKVEDLRKKWKIKDGGDIYVFFTTNINDEKIVIVCSKV